MKFTYTFKDYANTSYTYFTVAVYSWSYGLTDKRKHEFKISMTVTPTVQQEILKDFEMYAETPLSE